VERSDAGRTQHGEDSASDKLLVRFCIGPAAALNDWFSSRSVQNSYAVGP